MGGYRSGERHLETPLSVQYRPLLLSQSEVNPPFPIAHPPRIFLFATSNPVIFRIVTFFSKRHAVTVNCLLLPLSATNASAASPFPSTRRDEVSSLVFLF